MYPRHYFSFQDEFVYGLPFSVVSLLSKDPTPESVGQVGRVVRQFGGTVGRCELAVGGLEV